MLKISLIGAGNVATCMAMQFSKNQSILIKEIYSQKIENASSLTKKIAQGTPINTLDFEKSEADIIIVAIKDDAIKTIINQLKLKKDTIIVHTSGSQSLSILENKSNNIGVFYPLQTFSKEKTVDFKKVNICIESNNEFVEKNLLILSQALEANSYFISSNQRQTLHIAAVFSCNFVNHLWTLSQLYLEKNNINFELLTPLLNETLEKALSIAPKNAQTGPAQRNDFKIIEKHLALLKENENMQNIYQLLTQSIIELKNKE